MLSYFGVVEMLDLRQNMLTFRSTRDYPIGSNVKLRVQMPPGTGKVRVVQVCITQIRDQGKAGRLYRAEIVHDRDLPEFHGSDPTLRGGDRHASHIRVRSRALPGFRATAVDLSRTGAQLEVSGPVQAGSRMELDLDTEGFRHELVRCPAEVMWCRSQDGQRWRAGFHFLPTTATQQEQLEELAAFLGERAHSELEDLLDQARMLPPGESVLPVKPPPMTLPAQGTALPPLTVPTVPEVAAATPERRDAHRVLLIPLQARLDGYTRNLSAGSLFLRLAAHDNTVQTLEFPECQTVHDHCSGSTSTLCGLRTSTDSPLLDRLQLNAAQGSWKHYEFLGGDDQLVLELVSRQCRPAGS